MSPEGVYTATLAVDYGTAFAPGTAASQSFVLDLTPPTGMISLSSALFSPIESSDTISLKLTATSQLAKIDSWTMDIYDPGRNVFRSFTKKWPSDTAVWDGKGTNGDMVQSAEDYPVVAKIRDQFGNIGTVNATVPIDILVEKIATGYRILASRIFFKAFTADYRDVPPELAQQNMARLDALAAKLKKFPDYKITMIGHAVMINWDKPEAGREEQRAILIPLSKARADAVEAALVDRGLEKARFTTEGVGASDQLVPDSDYKDRWQNRRVALFLDKKQVLIGQGYATPYGHDEQHPGMRRESSERDRTVREGQYFEHRLAPRGAQPDRLPVDRLARAGGQNPIPAGRQPGVCRCRGARGAPFSGESPCTIMTAARGPEKCCASFSATITPSSARG